MRYPNLTAFKEEIWSTDPATLVNRWLTDRNPCAFTSEDDLTNFSRRIARDYPQAEEILIAGTANWQYSLNPNKSFSEFHIKSDVDIVLISPADFEETWERLRHLHRKQWYSWGKHIRESVMRTGQNVYCGFVSPKHIPDRTSTYRFQFLQRCNSYSSSAIGYREVNMMFFKSMEDVVDYYIRGVRMARSKV